MEARTETHKKTRKTKFVAGDRLDFSCQTGRSEKSMPHPPEETEAKESRLEGCGDGDDAPESGSENTPFIRRETSGSSPMGGPYTGGRDMEGLDTS